MCVFSLHVLVGPHHKAVGQVSINLGVQPRDRSGRLCQGLRARKWQSLSLRPYFLTPSLWVLSGHGSRMLEPGPGGA